MDFYTIFKIIVFIALLWFSFKLSFGYSPYDPNRPNARYIEIKNKALAKLLIKKRKPQTKDSAEEDDRCRLSLTSLIFYILQACLVIVSVALQFVPQMSCEPFDFPLGRHGAALTLSTYNEKIPLILAAVLLISELLYIVITSVVRSLKTKETKIKRKDIIILLLGLILNVFFLVYLLKNLF